RKKLSFELIFVDDGSVDNTPNILNQIKANSKNAVTIITFRKNFGKSAALTAGFNVAQGEIVITMDADLQDDPKEIPAFIQAIENGADVVTGWKKNRRDPLEKVIPSKFFNFVTSKLSGLKLHDYNCGFKAFKKEVLAEIQIYGELHRYILFLAHRKGFKVVEVPVTHHEREFGKSKFGFERYRRGLFDLSTVFFITTYQTRPMHLFGGVSTLLIVSGLSMILYLIFGRWINGISIGNSPLLLIAILFIGVGTQLLLTGFLAELIVYQRKTQERMEYSIKPLAQNSKHSSRIENLTSHTN
ncbi:MAG: glycosyltransferase family 2 protein, partial [Candidatus Margulisiibacteriota bacterium]